jgi:alpha-L-fucosidase
MKKMNKQNTRKFNALFVIILLLVNTLVFCQTEVQQYNNYVTIDSNDTIDDIIKKAAHVTPSKRQYEWQKLEMTAFVHFGINTFNEVEWGEKNTDISIFNPEKTDTDQWVKVLKEAGFKLIILTAKHHDGFCLWPSEYTDYNISNTKFKSGKGDIVKDLSISCGKAGIKFGVYLSPWDMHESSYGTDEYNKHFINQLTELLSNYGEISEVWFDGACGEGENGKKQVYDWQLYYKTIRELQPNAVIAVMGPDVRWVGTESGYGRKTEWSVLPGSSTDQESIANKSQQQEADGAFIPRNLMDEDLGSREKLTSANSLIWYPAEIDVSVRPGWFYKASEDDLVKTPEKLVDIYYNSVGLNGVLLLNVPPTKEGLIHQNDIKSLQGMRYILDETFKNNYALNGQIKVTSEQKGNEAEYIVDNDPETYWTTDENDSTASIQIKLKKGYKINCAMIQENILEGQRIEKFSLKYYDGQFWTTFAEGTTVGYKRLLRFPEIHADRVKIVIEKSRLNPTISSFGLFYSPPEVQFEPAYGIFEESMEVIIGSNSKRSKIFYTLDGSIPTEKSLQYKDKINLTETTTVKAIAISLDGKKSLPKQVTYNKAKYDVLFNSTFNDKYTGGGKLALVDGVKGSSNFRDGKWQGYNGSDVDFVIDLGEVKTINDISINFLRDINSFIFLPESVEFSFSQDNIKFGSKHLLKNDVIQQNDNAIVKTFSYEPENISSRYIHINAKNIKTCPEWHKGAGEKAWLFCDEISIE